MPLTQQDATDLKHLIHAKEAEAHPDLVVHIVHRSEDACEVEVEGPASVIAQLTGPGSYAGAMAKKISDTKAVFE